MVDSGAWGKLIHEKILKSKISWHCPFNLLTFKVWVGIKDNILSIDLESVVIVMYLVFSFLKGTVSGNFLF